MKILKIAELFNSAPGGGLRKDGPFSGEEFREDYLKPMLDSLKINESLLIDFDGAFGYSSSFLHEVFFAFYEKYPEYGNTRLIAVKSDEEPSICKEVTDMLYEKSNPRNLKVPVGFGMTTLTLLKRLNAMYDFQDCTCTEDQESGKDHTMCRKCIIGNKQQNIYDFIKDIYEEVNSMESLDPVDQRIEGFKKSQKRKGIRDEE